MATSEDKIKAAADGFISRSFGHQAGAAANAANNGLGKNGYQAGYSPNSGVSKMDAKQGALTSGAKLGENMSTQVGQEKGYAPAGKPKSDETWKGGTKPKSGGVLSEAARIHLARMGVGKTAANVGTAPGWTK